MRLRAALAAILVTVLTAPAAQAADLALTHARIYPSPDAAPIADGTVVVHDGRIVAVGPKSAVHAPRGAKVLDLKGAVVTAGFWNSHIHLMSPPLLKAETRDAAALDAELQAMLTRWGFTTVFDIASQYSNTRVIRERIAKGEVIGPKSSLSATPFIRRTAHRST